MEKNHDIVVGDILSLDPEEEFNFNIHFPYKRDELNILADPDGNLMTFQGRFKNSWGIRTD